MSSASTGSTAAKPPVLVRGRLSRLWSSIEQRRKAQLAALLALTLLASFAEVISIGAVLPFLGVLTAPEKVMAHPLMSTIVHWWRVEHPHDLLLPLTLTFSGAALLAAAIRIVAVWVRTRLTFAIGADISMEIYRRTLHQPYMVHLSRNSSELIDGISSKVSLVIQGVLYPVVVTLSNTIMVAIILAALLIYQPQLALTAFGGFVSLYVVIYFVTRARLRLNSRQVADSSTRRVKSLQEGLGGIRDVLLDRTQALYCREYQQSDRRLRKAQAEILVVGELPRFAIEALGMVVIAWLAFNLARDPQGFHVALPLVGALAIAAQRLLPLLQQVYYAVSNYTGSGQSLEDTLQLLEQPLQTEFSESGQSLPFSTAIQCQEIGFRYGPETPWVLRGLNLEIRKGSRTGFIGTTGSGKSTLLDVVMGLLHPTTGRLLVDGVTVTPVNATQWQRRIAHVPQAIYLSDASIAENIAFGVPKEGIDIERVRQAAKQAQIAEAIECMPLGYDALVGERGIRLSGGQRQRIGIARALYKRADVLVFDEATSALDNETESAVMQALDGLEESLTILIVAHRLSTLRNCDQLIELNKGCVTRIGPFEDIVKSNVNSLQH